MTTSNRSVLDASPSWSFTTIERLIKALAPIEDIWAALPSSTAVAQLKLREELLGVATLSCRAFELVHEIASLLGVDTAIIRHPPSIKASTKQTLIDGSLDGATVLVNKTITVRLDAQHFLVTGASNFSIDRQLLCRLIDEFRLPKRAIKACQINPADCSPESELRLLTGMVSPFIPPSLPLNKLRGVVLLQATEVDPEEEHLVAISLSPFESLVVRLADFDALAQHYVARAYPALQWAKIYR